MGEFLGWQPPQQQQQQQNKQQNLKIKSHNKTPQQANQTKYPIFLFYYFSKLQEMCGDWLKGLQMSDL